MNSSILLSIPDCIIRDVLTEWLELMDVGTLDSAVCSKAARARFLALAFIGNVYRHTDQTKYEMLQWSIKRGVCLDGFWVIPELLNSCEVQDEFLFANGPSIRWIKFGRAMSQSLKQCSLLLAKIAWFCPNTNELFLSVEHLPATFCDERYPQLIRSLPKLKLLSLTDSLIGTQGLLNLIQNCSDINELRLKNLAGEIPVEAALPSLHTLVLQDGNVPEAVLFAVASHCHCLKKFVFFETMKSGGVTDEAVQAILQGCPLLQYTDVEYARGLNQELCVELARRRNFTELVFYDDQWTDVNTQAWLQRILQVTPNVVDLELSEKEWVTDATLAMIAQLCPNLQWVSLADCRNITVAGLYAVLVPGNKQRKLAFAYCLRFNLDAVVAIPQCCPNLTELGFPPDVTSGTVVSLAEVCPLLEAVDLNFTGVDDAAIDALVQHCPSLHSFSLRTCDRITLESVHTITGLLRDQLRVLDLQYCGRKGERMGDEAVLAVAQRCPNLREFGCPVNTSREAIVTLAMACPLLKRLSLNSTQANDAAIITVTQHCPELVKIHAEQCSGVTRQAMEALEEEYPGLQVYADYQYWVEGDDMGDEDGKSEESEEEEEGDK